MIFNTIKFLLTLKNRPIRWRTLYNGSRQIHAPANLPIYVHMHVMNNIL
jgi:hypothetical protein